MNKIILSLFVSSLLVACSPSVGSKAWCSSLKEKHKSDWTMREMKDYTQYCVFK